MVMPEPFHDETARVLPQLRIDELLDELQGRVASVRSSRDRVRKLLEAVIAIGSGLDLEAALTKIVQAATVLVDARYGALGVIGEDQRLARFITVGMSPAQITAIGAYPQGRGLLGELIRHPVPLRVAELGAHAQSHGFPANHPPMSSFLGVPVRVRGRVYGNLYLTEKAGGAAFDADDEAVLTALAAAAGVAIDNARLFEDSRRLAEESQRHYAEARRRQDWLEITGELSRELLSAEPTENVMTGFVARVRAFAQADLALIAVAQAEQEGLLITAADGHGADRLIGTVVGIEDTLLGRVYKSGRPALVADVRRDEQAGWESDLALDLGPAFLAPLGASGQSRGALSVTRIAGADAFDQQTAELTAQLAVQAAVVLELAQRRRDSELLSLYADRDRIGRDLHDLAIQRLFATSMSLQSAYKITAKPEVARRIVQAVADLDETIQVIRSTIFSLNAHEMGRDASSVRAEVIGVCERATAVLGFPPAVRFAGPVDTLVGERIGEHLLAVLREALSNTARHAKASKVEVDVSADWAGITLTVADDGAGIPAGARRGGLANLRERAEQLNGAFTTTPRAGGGTVLVWTAPVPD
jgi:signal transduction histidine kinase